MLYSGFLMQFSYVGPMKVLRLVGVLRPCSGGGGRERHLELLSKAYIHLIRLVLGEYNLLSSPYVVLPHCLRGLSLALSLSLLPIS